MVILQNVKCSESVNDGLTYVAAELTRMRVKRLALSMSF